MKDGFYHWVIQEHGGATHAIGPYLSSDACHRRYESVTGGVVSEFLSTSPDAKETIRQFKEEKLGEL